MNIRMTWLMAAAACLASWACRAEDAVIEPVADVQAQVEAAAPAQPVSLEDVACTAQTTDPANSSAHPESTMPTAAVALAPVLPPPSCTALGRAQFSLADPDDTIVCVIASDDTLQTTRGGFSGIGLTASFGIDRITAINGVVRFQSTVNVADLSRLTPQDIAGLRSAIGSVNVVQNGANNGFTPPANNSLAGATFIQNSLNNQVITNSTVLNVTTNSQQLLKGINTLSTLRDVLTPIPVGR
ncbi:MAG: hypothetical protein JWP52_1667 [Rhizobacter sp.]|nr:hypothetical protein [Rhizobacter sp.]